MAATPSRSRETHYVVPVKSVTNKGHVDYNVTILSECDGKITPDKAFFMAASEDPVALNRISSTAAFYILKKVSLKALREPQTLASKVTIRMESLPAVRFMSAGKAYAEGRIKVKDFESWVRSQEIALLKPVAKSTDELNALGLPVIFETITSQHAQSVKDQVVDMPWPTDAEAGEQHVSVLTAMSAMCTELGMSRPDFAAKARKQALRSPERAFIPNTQDRKLKRHLTPEEARLVTAALAIAADEHPLDDEIEELRKEIAIARVDLKELEEEAAVQDGQADTAQAKAKDLEERAERVMLLVHALENSISKRNHELMVSLSVDITDPSPIQSFKFDPTPSTEPEDSDATAPVSTAEEMADANEGQTSTNDAATPSPERDVTKVIEDEASLGVQPKSDKVDKESVVQATPAPSSVVPAEATLIPIVKPENIVQTSSASSSPAALASGATLPTPTVIPLKRNAEAMDAPVLHGSSSSGGDDSGSHEKRPRA